ncbi:extracellular solute-binding protein [Quadrisphaera sp. GCM10027208]|uniref:extracellular solute-binding protein n=1 Tax=Quadrisphaera sp. GCM10027208 TaxID=3273423 RepID=UPI003622BB34
MARRPSGRSGAGAAAVAVGALLTLTACGGEAGGPPTLTWYVNPDAGGQERIAEQCTEESGGAYQIDLQRLPRDAPGQREQLVRRLAGNDTSVDLMSLDPPFIPEFAAAGYLADVPPDVAEEVTEDVVEGALAGATWKDELVTLPFWANTQLLWYRQSVAEEAGLDMEQPVTWEQVVDAAEQTGTTVAVQGTRAESMTVWVNALIESAGGQILENPEAEATEYELGIASEAGRRAAEIIEDIADSGVGGPQLATANEDINASMFESEDAGFMVNWPFVYQRAAGYVEAGNLERSEFEDYGWAVYPRAVEGEESRPPYGGINIGVSALSENVDLAFEAGRCIVQAEHQKQYFLSDGNPPAKASVYDDPEVVEQYPMAETIRESLENAAPRPQTPYYNEISVGIQRTWQPPSSVDPQTTPERSEELITDVLRGEALL